MALSYSTFGDISGNYNSFIFPSTSTNTYNNYNVAYEENYLQKSKKHEELLALYNEELEKRKDDFNYHTKPNEDEDKLLNETEIDFLKNVISIKNKILLLREKNKQQNEKLEHLKEEIKTIREIKTSYENFSKLYLSGLNKPGDKAVMRDIHTNLTSKKDEKKKLYKEINETLMKITTLKNIIRSDDFDSKTGTERENNGAVNDVVSDEREQINLGLLCFTCHENEITHCFTPCGHSFCETCVSRVDISNQMDNMTNMTNIYVNPNTICFMCRTPVKGKLRIYFS